MQGEWNMFSKKEVIMGIPRRNFIKNVGLGLAGLSLGTKNVSCTSAPWIDLGDCFSPGQRLG